MAVAVKLFTRNAMWPEPSNVVHGRKDANRNTVTEHEREEGYVGIDRGFRERQAAPDCGRDEGKLLPRASAAASHACKATGRKGQRENTR